jgi:hypothetical protein
MEMKQLRVLLGLAVRARVGSRDGGNLPNAFGGCVRVLCERIDSGDEFLSWQCIGWLDEDVSFVVFVLYDDELPAL